jgi:phosphatidylserine/phosphatidylglycerophosphate/cardiolipin synthase-like enzyme
VPSLIVDKTTPRERASGIEPLAHSGVPIWIDHGVWLAHAKPMVIDRKVVHPGLMNWTASAARNSEDLTLISSEAVAAAYTAHWQNRLVASVPFARREELWRSHEMAGFKSESPPR